MTTTLTARSPEDLIAVVPVVLGFEPADSVVMLTLGASRTFHARVDLPGDPVAVAEVVELLLEPAVRHRAQGAVFVIYTGDEEAAREVVRLLRAREPGASPRVLEALRVHGGRWFPLLRDHDGPGGAGVGYDVSGHPFLAEAVYEGRVIHGSRAALGATLRPDPGAVAEVEAARGGPPSPRAWVAAFLDDRVGGDQPPDPGEVARLLGAIAVPAVRDVAWGRVRRASAGEDVRFWTDVVRRAPEDLVAHAAAVLGFAAWVAGDGALAWCAVDRAREPDPGHSLAGLVADLLVGAVAPSEWEEVPRGLGSAP